MSKRHDFQTRQFDRVWHPSAHADEIVPVVRCAERGCILPAGLGGRCILHRPSLFELYLQAMMFSAELKRKRRLKQLQGETHD